MKRKRSVGVLVVAALLILAGLHCYAAKNERAASVDVDQGAQPFLGRWDLTLKAPDREYPSWLEVSVENGQLKAQMAGRWGNARPLPKVEVTNGHIEFVSPHEEEDSKVDLVFEGDLTGETLTGTLNGPDGKKWKWTGVRAPSLKRSHAPTWGKPIKLFNGRDLSGWKMDKPNPSQVWAVENGALTSPGNGPELINDRKFEDFKLHVEFNCGENANSGIYLRGRYEVQIETDSIEEPPSHHMGAVYGFLAPTPELPRKPGEWQTFDVTLVGRMITVVQNGKTIIDNKEIPGITGGALDSHEAAPGPIYLQGSEKGHVAFRSIVITPAEAGK
jgi:3-keto-disaccharide hydrolase